MRYSQDFIMLIDLVTRVRASGLPHDLAEAAIAAALEEYAARAQEPRLLAAARRLAEAPKRTPDVGPAKAAPLQAHAKPAGNAAAGKKVRH